MIFRKKIQPACEYCRRSTEADEGSVGCERHGIVPRSYSCGGFKYDPLKRVPPPPVILNKKNISDEDFKL